MNREDQQILRHAALELMTEPDMVRVAGVLQRVKNWWKARFNTEFAKNQEMVDGAYDGMKGPLGDLITRLKELDGAFKSQDPEEVSRILSDVQAAINKVDSGVDNLKKKINKYEDSVSKAVSDRGYQGEDTAGDAEQRAQWEMLPEQFRNQIKVNVPMNIPIMQTDWYGQNYSTDNVTVASQSKPFMKKVLVRELTRQLQEYLTASDIEQLVELGFEGFVENLRQSILAENTILVRVEQSKPSKTVTRRTINQMQLEVNPGPIILPAGQLKLPVNPGSVLLTDLGTSARGANHELVVWAVKHVRLSTEAYKILRQAIQYREEQDSPIEDTEPKDDVEEQPEETQEEKEVEASGPITSLIKRAILRDILPTTHAVVKISGSSFRNLNEWSDTMYREMFGTVLSKALRQEIDAEAALHSSDGGVEVQVKIAGSKMASLPAIYGISMDVAERFKKATMYGAEVEVDEGKSKLQLIEPDALERSKRQVTIDCWSERGEH